MWPELLHARKNIQRWFQVELALNGHLMLHLCKNAAILKCSHLTFSMGAMCLIVSALTISITGCVLSEGTCRTTLNPLQPADFDKGWQDIFGHTAREQERTSAYGCLCCCQLNIPIYSKDRMTRLTPNHWRYTVFLCIWTVWLHNIFFRQVWAFDQDDLWLFLHCAPKLHKSGLISSHSNNR